ncbi:MAG: transcriptional repressor [Alphaproteobacteria bacterium]|nr:transcriptional repressor [Alphaproteobacteria bacterium]
MPPRQKHDRLTALLQGAGLRPTRQRLALAGWLFDGCDKHVTAEQVHAAALKQRVHVSLATVYNTLNAFMGAGLLRQVAVDGGQIYFDTNTGDHHHIFDEDSGHLTDIAASSLRVSHLPKLPSGKNLARIDVVLRVRVRT